MEKNPENSTKKKQPDSASYMRYATMGTQMLVIMGLGVFGGYCLDKHFGMKIPVFTLVLSLASVAAAIYLSIKDFIGKK